MSVADRNGAITAASPAAAAGLDLTRITAHSAITILDQFTIRCLSDRPVFDYIERRDWTQQVKFECTAAIKSPSLTLEAHSGTHVAKRSAKAEAALRLCLHLEELGQLNVFRANADVRGVYDFSKRKEKKRMLNNNSDCAVSSLTSTDSPSFKRARLTPEDLASVAIVGQPLPVPDIEPTKVTDIFRTAILAVVSRAPQCCLLMSELGNQLLLDSSVTALRSLKPKLKTFLKGHSQLFAMFEGVGGAMTVQLLPPSHPQSASLSPHSVSVSQSVEPASAQMSDERKCENGKAPHVRQLLLQELTLKNNNPQPPSSSSAQSQSLSADAERDSALSAQHSSPALLSVPWQLSPLTPSLFHSYTIDMPNVVSEYQLTLLTVSPLPLHRLPLSSLLLYSQPQSQQLVCHTVTYTGRISLTASEVRRAMKWQLKALNVVSRREDKEWMDGDRWYLLLPTFKRGVTLGISANVDVCDDSKDANDSDTPSRSKILAERWESLKAVIPQFAALSVEHNQNGNGNDMPQSASEPMKEHVDRMCDHFLNNTVCQRYQSGQCPYYHHYRLPPTVSECDVLRLLPESVHHSPHNVDFSCIGCHARVLPAHMIARLSDGRVYARIDQPSQLASESVLLPSHGLCFSDRSLQRLMLGSHTMALNDSALFAEAAMRRLGESAVTLPLQCSQCSMRVGDYIVPSPSMPITNEYFPAKLATVYVCRLWHYHAVNGRYHMFPVSSDSSLSLAQAIEKLNVDTQSDSTVPLLSQWRGFAVAEPPSPVTSTEIAWQVMAAQPHSLSLSDFRSDYSLKHCVLVTPHNGLIYSGVSLSMLTAGSPFPNPKMPTYAAHFQSKLGVDCGLNAPMLDVRHFSGTGVDVTVTGGKGDTTTCMRVLPQHTVVMGQPLSVYILYQFVPSLLYKLECFLLQDEAYHRLALSCDQALLNQSLTCSNVDQRDNLERLEFLGDSILKYYYSLAVYQYNVLESEYILTKRREMFVSNASLSQCARHGGWLRYVRLCRFHPKQLPLSGLTVSDPSSLNESLVFSNKIQADVTEAIIGACYLSNADTGSDESVKLLLARMGVQSEGIRLSFAKLLLRTDYQFAPLRSPIILTKTTTEPHFDLGSIDTSLIPVKLRNWLTVVLPAVQSTLGYQFKRVEWLIEACLHGSILQEKEWQPLALPHYASERLEFLGDALIDRINTDYLYRTLANNATPGIMTLQRQKLVCNEVLARVCVHHNLHRALLHASDSLTTLMDGFVTDWQTQRALSASCSQRNDWKTLGNSVLRAPPKVLADMTESIFAAVLIDSGRSFGTVERVWHSLVKYKVNDNETTVAIDFQ